VRRRDVQTQLLHEPGQPRRLAFGQVEHKGGERGGVDDRVRQRAFEAAPDQPCVEGVVAVLDENGTLSESKKSAAGVAELGRSDQHRPVDVVALARVRVDRRSAVDERIEERKCAGETEPLGSDLKDEKWRVAGGLDVDSHKLGVVERRFRPHVRSVDCDLLPRHRLHRTARLEEYRLASHGAMARARRASLISSGVTARKSKTATV
jgi:hypothetical protein